MRKRFGASPARIEKSLKGGGEEVSNKFCPIFSCNPVAPNPLRTGLYMIIGRKQLDRRGGKDEYKKLTEGGHRATAPRRSAVWDA